MQIDLLGTHCKLVISQCCICLAGKKGMFEHPSPRCCNIPVGNPGKRCSLPFLVSKRNYQQGMAGTPKCRQPQTTDHTCHQGNLYILQLPRQSQDGICLVDS